jgi:hypothetical protein
VNVSNVKLKSFDAISMEKSFRFPPGTIAHLSFSKSAPAMKQFKEKTQQSEEPLSHKFSVSYETENGDSTFRGVFERLVCYKFSFRDSSIHVLSRCINLDSVRVGSPTSFVFSLKRKLSDKVVVQSCFSSPDIKAVPLYESSKAVRMSSAQKEDKAQRCNEGDKALVVGAEVCDTIKYIIAFDRNEWIMVGSERNRIDMNCHTEVSCDFIAIKLGVLRTPTLVISGDDTLVIQKSHNFIKVLG